MGKEKREQNRRDEERPVEEKKDKRKEEYESNEQQRIKRVRLMYCMRKKSGCWIRRKISEPISHTDSFQGVTIRSEQLFL
jgi:hypothetical protein